ncbi:unnamed protein product [Rhizoctonia solani]|uniref:Major facilitator superfamily (MFS) profile domain-containing protein n=1 Tax=Rhizoctonia solani TaxID=456999 RepID=A0A8H2XL27_9AGAM|nr:unnamed protein product [Rhizoctonia solani]
MIEELGVTSDPKELGYYSGLIEGMFSLAQFFTVYFWGSLSDRIGRRPVLISGLCGVVGSTIMFRLSKSFAAMLFSRALCGMLNGNSSVIKSPALVSLPSSVSGRIRALDYRISGLIAGVLFLEESLPKNSARAERRPLLVSKPRTYSQPVPIPTNCANFQLSAPDDSSPILENTKINGASAKEIILTPYIHKILVSYGFMAYVTMAINALMVLWLYTPVKTGGIGFSVSSNDFLDQISSPQNIISIPTKRILLDLELIHEHLQSAEIEAALALFGLFGIVVTIIVFPPLERRLGALFLYRFSMVMQILTSLLFPLGHVFTLAGGGNGAYIGVGAMLVARCIGGMVCNILLVTRSAPSSRSRGTVNAIAQMVASASRAVALVMTTSLLHFRSRAAF